MKSLTREQIREIDRRAIEEYGMPGIMLMENAGRNTAVVILEEFQWSGTTKVCILCGGGNNGGDGYVIARHLFNAGLTVSIVTLSEPSRLAPDAKINHDIAKAAGISIVPYERTRAQQLLSEASIVVDALLGTGFSGDVRSPQDEAIGLINAAAGQCVAVDVPSGLDCDTGEPANATVKADLTVTFVARKIGFDVPPAPQYTGRVVVADIGVPRTLLARMIPTS